MKLGAILDISINLVISIKTFNNFTKFDISIKIFEIFTEILVILSENFYNFQRNPFDNLNKISIFHTFWAIMVRYRNRLFLWLSFKISLKMILKSVKNSVYPQTPCCAFRYATIRPQCYALYVVLWLSFHYIENITHNGTRYRDIICGTKYETYWHHIFPVVRHVVDDRRTL